MAKLLPLLAILLVGAAFLVPVQPPGCSQTAHLALVRSLERGTAQIDRYHWQTCDKSWFEGHFYTAKSPGLALFSLPLYTLLGAVGLAWDELPATADPSALYEVPGSAIWPLTLWGAGVAALALLLMVGWAAERIAPGYGTATAVVLGLGTLVLPYATLYTSHMLAVACAFGAFVLLFKEREGRQRLRLVGAAGALAAFAVAVDNPLGLVTVALALYALTRGGRLRRCLAYGTGVLLGILPMLVYNQWAFGDFTHQAYEGAVISQGQSGHDIIGANAPGFFGITVPRPEVAIELLLSGTGLLVITPVVAVAFGGLLMLYRRGRRAEAVLIGALSIAYVLYNSGYYLPFGGDSAGPRFLVPILPFLALPLALTWKRFPLTVGSVALVSAGTMAIATSTEPMLGHLDTGIWGRRLLHGDFTETVFSVAGAGDGWPLILPFFVLVAAALAVAAVSLPPRRLRRRDLETALAAVAAWGIVSTAAPALLESGPSRAAAAGAVTALTAALGWAVWFVATRPSEPRDERTEESELAGPSTSQSAPGIG